MSLSVREIIRAFQRKLQGGDSTDTSQGGEVAALRALIQPDDPKYLVDVGAHDGKYLSNSWPFIQAGWQAIAIEPLPSVYNELVKNHRSHKNVACLNLACADKPGNVPLYLGIDGEQGQMSTLCTDDNEWFRQNRSSKSILVEVDTLTRILDQHHWPSRFTVLLVDAEGMDYEVLLGLDFNKYQPRIIVTEEYVSNPEKHQKKYDLLRSMGYTYHSLVAYNTIWIR
jgi:FkbM family methyltransferase